MMKDLQPDIRIKRKLFSVYAVFFLSGLVLLLWTLMMVLSDLGLLFLGYAELWFVFFVLIFGLILLRLIIYLPFIVKSLPHSLKPYSLSVPLIISALFIISLLSVMVPIYINPLRNTTHFLNTLLLIFAVLFGMVNLVSGFYGIRKLRIQEWRVLNPSKENLAGIKGPAKTMYWIYFLSGLMVMFFWLENALVEGGYWPELLNFKWSIRLSSIQNLLFLAIPLVYLYHYWFFLYLIRHFRRIPSLSVPTSLLGLYFISIFFSGWDIMQFSVKLYGIIALISGAYGLYTFKKNFNSSG